MPFGYCSPACRSWSSDAVDADDFPSSWRLGAATDLGLGYRFEPGAADDGVTVDVPVATLNHIDEAPFKEGDEVHEGDLLFRIDPRPFQADLNLAEANLKQAEAEREKRAKIIHAEGEFQASQQLAEAADIINQNPVTIQLRYLQTLLEIGSDQGQAIGAEVASHLPGWRCTVTTDLAGLPRLVLAAVAIEAPADDMDDRRGVGGAGVADARGEPVDDALGCNAGLLRDRDDLLDVEGDAAGGVGAGVIGGMKIGTDQALGGRGFLDFGNHCGLSGRDFRAHGTDKITGHHARLGIGTHRLQ